MHAQVDGIHRHQRAEALRDGAELDIGLAVGGRAGGGVVGRGLRHPGVKGISLVFRVSTTKFAPNAEVWQVSRMNAPTVKLDSVNRRIIEILQREGRCPFTTIAREVGISEAAVRARMQRLTDAGVLDVVAVTNPLKLGFEVMALVGVQANSDLERVARTVSDWRETSYVVITSGSYDLLVEVVCEHNRHLLEAVQRLREIDGVKSTETFMYLDMVKMTYAWGTR